MDGKKYSIKIKILYQIVNSLESFHTLLKAILVLQSKGGILAKACEYIVELRQLNQRMGDYVKENERLAMQVESLRQQNEELRRESVSLRNQLTQHGINPISTSSPSSTSQQRSRDLSS
jgi:SMC interacting uncharacterized protein involved in chromosome segregation